MSNDNPKPQRRRGTALETTLLDAAWKELHTVGYDQLTFEGVAKRAGTSKTVLYRRWPNRFELVRAVLQVHRPLLSGHSPDTGSLRGDIVAILDYMASGMDEIRINIAWGMLTDAISDKAQHSSLLGAVRTSNITTMKAILDRAIGRGEISSTTVPDRILTLPIDLVRHEMLITGRPPTKAATLQIVDEIYMPLITLDQTKSA